MTTLNFKYFILLFFILGSSCPPRPPSDFCNTQHPSSECWLEPPSFLQATSYNDHSIMLKFDFISNDSLINIPDTLIIHRQGPNNDIDLNIAFYDTLQEFIDTTAYDTGQYIYSTSVKNNNGRSLFFDDSTSSTVNHIIPEITEFKIDKIFCDSILLSWTYEIPNTWNTDSSFFFVLERSADSIITSYDILKSHQSLNNYTFADPSYDFETEYQYTIFFQGDSLNSTIKYSMLSAVTIPKQLETKNWIPISSDIIYLEWDIGGRLDNYNKIQLTNTTIENQIIEINSDNPSKQGYYIDSLSIYNQNNAAGTAITYKIDWICNENKEDEKDSDIIRTSTLPYYHMVYIPAISPYEYEEKTALDTSPFETSIFTSDPFYIDVYELSNIIFDDNTSNVLASPNDTPKDSITADIAKVWASNRQPNITDMICADQLDVEFRLPADYEWQIASRCEYDWDPFDESTTCGSLWDYPYPLLNNYTPNECLYVNCITDPVCEDLSKPMSVNFAPLALTPFGLQGASGNLKEWVENTVRNDLGGNEYGKLMGGDFSNISDDVKTTSAHLTNNPNAISKFNGFRTVFSADLLIDWKSCIE